MADQGSLLVYMTVSADLAERNRESLLELLALIRHRGMMDPRVAHGDCLDCAKFGALAASTEEWPWRDYPIDPPLAGDL